MTLLGFAAVLVLGAFAVLGAGFGIAARLYKWISGD